MKRISVLKPDIRRGIMKNENSDKFTYLSIPKDLGKKDLKRDIKFGAVQFKDILNKIEKKKDSKYIVITTENLEMGYMAITYLAACYNEKNEKECEDYYLNDEKTGIEEWIENDFQIPIIEEFELNQFYGDNNNPFAIGDIFAQANSFSKVHKPYWVDCTNSAVCIVMKELSGCWGINFEISLDSLDIFNNNERVYVLIEKQEYHDWNKDFQSDNIDEFYDDGSMEKTKSLILNYIADDIVIKLEEKLCKEYYIKILKGFFEKNSIIVNRGFGYSKIINVIMSMRENNKCEIIEKIVKYAIKDLDDEKEKKLNIKDFDFIERFVKIKKVSSKELSEKKIRNELIGMDSVKEQIFDIINVMRYNKLRLSMNIDGSVYHNVHAMLGAPGTAKTTMAKYMGEMMVEKGLLKNNRFICVNGAELKGMYVGHSAPKTKALFENYDIIVIDEAYSLVDSKGETDSFSNEAISQLIIELEEHSMDKLVVFTGYGGKKVTEKNNRMRNFLDSNPGIKSRITSTIYFDSYSPEEMVEIFYNMARVKKFIIDDVARDAIYSHFCNRVKDENFGNGREARSLLETCILFGAKRLFENEKKTYTKIQMQTLIKEDIVNAIKRIEHSQKEAENKNIKVIGF